MAFARPGGNSGGAPAGPPGGGNRRERSGLFSGPCPVAIPDGAWDSNMNIRAVIAAFLQMNGDQLMTFIGYYQEGHAAGSISNND